jgi:hypothetical protein
MVWTSRAASSSTTSTRNTDSNNRQFNSNGSITTAKVRGTICCGDSYLAKVDIPKAFGNVGYNIFVEVALERGVHADLVAAMLVELASRAMGANLGPFVAGGVEERRGGRQRGRDTPTMLNFALWGILRPVFPNGRAAWGTHPKSSQAGSPFLFGLMTLCCARLRKRCLRTKSANSKNFSTSVA